MYQSRKSDLIYRGSKNKDGELETFRYTQNQRHQETRNKKYNKIIVIINKEHETDTRFNINLSLVNYERFKLLAI